MPVALYVLALSAFAIGSTEFGIVSLLPAISETFNVTTAEAGLLISVYAGAVVLGASTLHFFINRWPVHRVVTCAMFVFALANIGSALADKYGALAVCRALSGFAQGGIYGIGTTVATRLVPPDRAARAVAVMFAGPTLAMVAGVPLTAYLVVHFGWRVPLAGIGGVGILCAGALASTLPAMSATTPRGDITYRRLLGHRQLSVIYLVTAFGFGGSSMVFSYLPSLTRALGDLPVEDLGAALAVFGGGTVAGNFLGGFLSDRYGFKKAAAIVLAGLALTLAVFLPAAGNPLALHGNLAFWGLFAFAVPPIMQAGAIGACDRGIPEMAVRAAGLNIAAFNVGCALAAMLGGGLLTLLGDAILPLAGALLVSLALAFTMGVGRQKPES